MRTEIIKFLTSFVQDMPKLYWIDGSVGHNIYDLLGYIELGRDDIVIVETYGKFIKVCLSSLFGKAQTIKVTTDKQQAVEGSDEMREDDLSEEEREALRREADVFPEATMTQVMLIAKQLETELKEICSGATRFKHEHEKCCSSFLSAGLEFLHLSILTNKLGPLPNDFTRSLILQHMFKILVDSLIKDLSTEFIFNLRDKLLYEISLIEKLNRRAEMALSFDVSNLTFSWMC